MKPRLLHTIFAFAVLSGIFIAGISLKAVAHAGNQPQSQAPALASPAAPVASAAIQQKIEAYLRHLYAWGPSFKLTFGPPKETPIPNVNQVTVEVSTEGQSDSATFYVTKDGRYLMRGEIEDLNADPLAEIRKQMPLEGNPSKGPADARVVLVEYADYECPSCRQLDMILRTMLPNFPQVRLVFKDFPLVQIHPWAATAANAGRCAFRQNPGAYWKFHDLVFDNQETVTPENAWQKMQGYATDAALDAAEMRTCMADPQTQEEVKKSMAEGDALHVANTPTIFVNGRRIIGPDAATLEQYIRYELTPPAKVPPPTSNW